jgi:hypothetical protein
MDWFERITGFREGAYDETRSRLLVEGSHLHSRVNGKSYVIGTFELVSLDDLRRRVARVATAGTACIRVSNVVGNVRKMHRDRENVNALFQVASQFNMLEMTSQHVTPEDGVTRYQNDRTQGPACAIAAGAATIYRNYFVPVGEGFGQTAQRQLDGLGELGGALSAALHRPVSALWKMQNGYAMCTPAGLGAAAHYLKSLGQDQIDALRGKLRVGLHSDIEVTDADGPKRHFVSQVFCSALPLAYSSIAGERWEALARLILEATYEASIWCAMLNASRGASNRILLTSVGGGAFGNKDAWINEALRRGLELAQNYDLDVRLVSYKAPSMYFTQLAKDFH